MSNREKFGILLWKNWRLKIHRPVRTMCEILLPVLAVFLLVIARQFLPSKTVFSVAYNEFQPDLELISTYHIAYAPETSPIVKEIMESVKNKLNTHIQGYNSEEETITMLQLASKPHVAVIFPEAYINMTKLPKKVQFTLRFAASATPITSWKTDRLYPVIWKSGPRDREIETTPMPGYDQSGFLALQNAISEEIIEIHSNAKLVPQIYLRRFPYPDYRSDILLVFLDKLIAVCIILGFSLPVLWLIRDIAIEKEIGLRERMKLLGATTIIQWTAWFSMSFICVSITVFLIDMVLKISFWYKGESVALLHHTDALMILLLLHLYGVALVTFCLAMGVLFKRANSAAIYGCCIFVLMYLPLVLIFFNSGVPWYIFVILCLFFNTAMGLVFYIIVHYEMSGEGANLYNMFHTVTPDHGVTLCVVMLMLIVDSIMHFCIALYVDEVFPGHYGNPKKWHYIFDCFKKKKHKEVFLEYSDDVVSPSSEYFEATLVTLPVGVETRRLSKSYPTQPDAVNNLNMKLYSNEITVLLGHDGSGKSTIMLMLSGILQPTWGSITYNELQQDPNLKDFQQMIGFCPQQNILFDHLTVDDHIYLFTRLKGVEFPMENQEVDYYTKLMKMEHLRNTRTKRISDGMKRRLSVAIAFCGFSKVVLLDEPTAKTDPATRRAIWDVIISQKEERTILSTTRFAEEAEILGDRIAIINKGQLQCNGSANYWETKFVNKYHLSIMKTFECNVDNINSILTENLSQDSVSIVSDTTEEVIFAIAKSDCHLFPGLFAIFESDMETLGIKSFAVHFTTIEEILLKLGTIPTTSSTNIVSIDHHKKASGLKLSCNRLFALVLKRVYYFRHNRSHFLMMFLLPVIFFLIAYALTPVRSHDNFMPPKSITMEDYTQVEVLMQDLANDSVYKKYAQRFFGDKSIVSRSVDDLLLELLQMIKPARREALLSYILALELFEETIIVWFNAEPYHTPPLALNVAYNTILKRLDPEFEIIVINHPLPTGVLSQLDSPLSNGSLIAYFVVIGLCLFGAVNAKFYADERKSKVRHLQIVSGVGGCTFWWMALIIDCCLYSFLVGLLVGILLLLQFLTFAAFDDIVVFVIVLMYFGGFMLPAIYLFTSWCSAKVTLAIISMGVVFHIALNFVMNSISESIITWIDKVLSYTGSYAAVAGLIKLYAESARIKQCKEILDLCLKTLPVSEDECWIVIVRLEERCKEQEKQLFGWGQFEITRYLFGSLLIGGILFLILLLYQSHGSEIAYCCNSNCCPKFNKLPMHTSRSNSFKMMKVQDNDVLLETDYVKKLTKAERRQKSLILRNVMRNYGSSIAIKGINVAIKPFESFVFIGANGSGKSSLCGMITGDLLISSGDIFINGLSIKKNQNAISKYIGYCPYSHALFNTFTVRETLYFFGLLKGYNWNERYSFANTFASEFEITSELDMMINQLSVTNKRKLNIALAIMGDPHILCLDEPTIGMDPTSKQYIWEIIKRFHKRGKCIILATHNMEECKALATRIAVVFEGQLSSLGTIQHLRNKFSTGIILSIRLPMPANAKMGTKKTEEVHTNVTQRFPNAVLRERHMQFLKYEVVYDEALSWSQVFANMLYIDSSVSVLDFSIAQMSFEKVYMRIAREEDAKQSTE